MERKCGQADGEGGGGMSCHTLLLKVNVGENCQHSSHFHY